MKESVRRLLNPAWRAFLRDRPEWEDEVRITIVAGKKEAVVSSNAVLVFTVWCKERGLVNAEEAGRFGKFIEDVVAERFSEGQP